MNSRLIVFGVTSLACCTALHSNANAQPGFDRGRVGNPVEKVLPQDLDIKDGAAAIPDHATYQKLSYKGEEVMIDTFLSGLEFVKFTIDDAFADEPSLYFINTVTHRAHMMFARVAGLPRGGFTQMKGVLVYRPRLKSPSGNAGLYTFEFEPFDTYSFDMVQIAHEMLIEKMPGLNGNIGYFPRQRGIEAYNDDKKLYEEANLPVYLEEDLTNSEVAFLPLNITESFGRLRIMDVEDRPNSRDIVIYKSLPNELSRVAGIITSVRQTPLSHVNLRAVQDKVPNAFISNAADNKTIRSLVNKYVYYKVSPAGYELRAATDAEVESHYADLRPAKPQTPPRDLTVTTIRSLDDISFTDATSVGVKAANLATMQTFEFPDGTVPDGFAVPFYFYDEFMKHNGFYEKVDTMLSDPKFQKDQSRRESALKKFRKKIKKGRMPKSMTNALADVQGLFPDGTAIRCRSSTNNEDLPGFSGAGLYDSFTHHEDEGHLAKTIRQVYSSLWNFRAFEERDFYRIDHKAAAMGVLMHANFSDEQANGVAVTDDILYETLTNYYINTQVGENLVTNPDEASMPEELLLGWFKEDGHQVMRKSNHSDEQLLNADHIDELRSRLARIHGRF